MYNFLVTGQIGAWESSEYICDSSRFGEYTSESVRENFDKLSEATIERLKSFPTLFAYEGGQENLRVGYLRSIRNQGKTIAVIYELETDIPEIPFAKISELKLKLDIRKYEMNRTHWAIKDANLFEVLFGAGLIPEKFVN